MAINTSKNILITPGGFSSNNSSISQIDLKWYESGIGTFVFSRGVHDLRSTIYNWHDANEPVLQFGGMGTVGNQQFFVGPYSDYVGNFTGISSAPSVKIYPISGQLITNVLKVGGELYDSNNSTGMSQQILSSTSSGIAWTNPASVGIVTGSGIANYVVKFTSLNTIGTSYITDDGSTININLPVNSIITLADATIHTITVGLGAGSYPTNLALGKDALLNNTSSINAIAVGYQANLNSTSLSNSVTLGVRAGQYSNASNSVALGNFALQGSATTYLTGSDNVAIGYQAGQNIGSASYNVIIGSGAQVQASGTYQIAIGYGVYPSNSNLGAWGGATNATRTDLGIGTFASLARLHLETLSASNKGLYIAGSTSQTANLLQIDATTSGTNYITVNGIGSMGIGTSAPTQSLHIQNGIRINESLYDSTNSSGLSGNILTSLSSGIAWSSVTALGIVTGAGESNQIAVWNSANKIVGFSTFVYTGLGSVGIGTPAPTQLLHIQGNTRITGGIYDSSNNIGLAGSVLTSTGAGIAWTVPVGTFSGTISSGQVAYASDANSLTGSNNFWFTGSNLGIGTSSPSYSLTVQGNVYVSGFVTSTGFFGPGTNLTNLNASSLASGTVPSTRISGSYSGITSVGTLSQLNVSGFVTSAGFFGPGTNLTNLNASNLASGTVPSTRISGSYSGITSVGTLSQLNVSGFVTSAGFFGPGTNLTNLNASNLASGTVPSTRISGSYSGITSVGILSSLVVQSDALINGLTVGVGAGSSTNTALGYQVFSNSSGQFGVAIGYQAAQYLSANTNTIIGFQAAQGSPTTIIAATSSVIIGYQAGQFLVGTGANSIIGRQAMQGSSSTFLSGDSNAVVGYFAARFLNSGYNVAIGRESLQSVDGASPVAFIGYNVAVGYQALTALTTGTTNVALGRRAGDTITTGTNNTFVGASAGGNATSQYQIALGGGSVVTASNLGAWGGATNSTRTDLGVGTFTPLARLHIETLSAANPGLYIAGSASQTSNLFEIDATTNGNTLFVVTGVGSVGVGTMTPTSSFSVQGSVYISGITTSSFYFGNGTNLTNLNASNLASGTVPSSVITGTYSGITSVGTLSQLNVSGITTVNSAFFKASFYDINNSSGSSGNILASIGAGVAWSTPPQLGLVTGTGASTQIAYWNNANQIIGSNNFVITGLGSVGIGTVNPANILAVQGDALINSITVGLGPGNTPATNTTVGFQAFSNNIAGQFSVAIGYQAGQYLNASSNTVVGYQALTGSSTTTITATSSVIVGFSAGQFLNGGSNVLVGRQAMQGSTTTFLTSGNNVAVGFQAGQYLNGSSNAIVGYTAMAGSATTYLSGGSNVILGTFAARYLNSNFNIAIGREALQSTDGAAALFNGYNVAIGYQALTALTTGTNNSAIGRVAGNTITTGSNNTFVGSGAGGTATGQYQIALGLNAVVTASNLGAWGGVTNATRTDQGIGTFTPLARLHIETLAAGNKGLYIAGFASQTANLLQIDATTSGTNYVTVGAAGSVGIGTATPTQSLHIQNGIRLTGRFFDNNNSSGTTGQVLAATASGLAWTSAGSGTISGSASASQIAYFASASNIAGISTFVYLNGNVGIGTATPTQNLHVQTGARFNGPIYDSNNSAGGAGQVLSSTVTGVAWTNAGAGGGGTITGSVAANQVAFGIAANSIQGSNNLWFNGSSLGIGTSSVTQTLTVQGNATVSGITTSGTFSGSGSLITSLNASNLAAGTVPSSAISGTYSGITSVGTLSQLFVSGFSTVYSLWLDAQVYDINNSSGSTGNILSSIGVGVAWSSTTSLGIVTGTAAANQISYWSNSNQITGISTFVIVNGNVGIGTASPQQTLHTIGTARVDGTLILNANSTDTKTQRIFAGASISTTSTSFITVASINVPTGYQLSIEGKANGWFSTTLNEAGTFFAVFFNSVGITSAVGSTDIMSKYTGSSGNFTLSASGANVQIQVKADSGSNLWFWKTQYDYLLTQNT